MDQSFLEIGRHCSEVSCRQLDFLPFKCPSCSLPFCSSHWRPPSGHSCPSYNPRQFDNRVPSCPLCSLPVPLPSGPSSDPNISMDHHLSTRCETLHPHLAAEAHRNKDKHECQVNKCKVKLAVLEFKCDKCRGNFCATHRYETDHACRERQVLERGEEDKKKARRGGGGFFSKLSRGNHPSSRPEDPNPNPNPTPRVASSTTTTTPRERLDGIGQAGLAALRRAQQQASSSTFKPTQTITIPDSDSSSVEIVSSKPAAANPIPASSSRSKPSSSSSSSQQSKLPPALKPTKAVSKRAQAEQASARKALEARYERGLLSEKEKLKFAEMRAMEAKEGGGGGAKDKDGCRIA